MGKFTFVSLDIPTAYNSGSSSSVCVELYDVATYRNLVYPVPFATGRNINYKVKRFCISRFLYVFIVCDVRFHETGFAQSYCQNNITSIGLIGRRL